MTITRFTFILTIASLLNLVAGCQGPRRTSLSEALALYKQNKLEQALPLFEQLVAEDPDNAEGHVWLAETSRRLGKKEEAVKEARRVLELNPRSSFAHTVIAEVSNPVLGEWAQANSDTTWFHLMQAIECDSSDAHPWLIVWGEAIRRGEPSMMRTALRRLVETRFLTKAALAYGRWMLRALPRKAILLTNGDMDTYPPCAVQEVEGFRRDVVIVNRGTLEMKWYARFLRDYAGVPLPLDDAQIERFEVHSDQRGALVTLSDEIIHGWLEQKSRGSFDRPLAVAVTVDENVLSGFKDNMRFAGSFLEWRAVTAAGTPDTASMHASLEGLSPEDFTGPWVSDQDRSPVRRVYTKNIVRTVTVTSISYSEFLLGARRFAEARRWATWSDELDRKAELGPVFTERIARLKERLANTAQ